MWLVILSGIGLVTLVLLNLGESLRTQEQNARAVAQRDAERGARELRTALEAGDWLLHWPAQSQFQLKDEQLVIPESVGWLTEDPKFAPDTNFDPILLDHLRRAERAPAEEAASLWRKIQTDPLARGAAGQWIAMRIAWFAHQTGDYNLRDDLIAQLDTCDIDQVAVSLLLLCAEANLPVPTWTRASLPRLVESEAKAAIDRLAEHGLDVESDRVAMHSVHQQRANLRKVQPWVARLAMTNQVELLATDEELVFYYPELERGALLTFNELRNLVEQLSAERPGSEPLLALGGLLVADNQGAAVVKNFASVHPKPILEPPLLSGATGFGLLAIALALLSGGGAFFTLRGARREAEAARLRTEFVTGVTHELKTPLTGIRLTADLLREGYVHDEERQQIHLTRLAGESLRLGVLIDNVLDLGRFERGERGHHPERADLVELVTETVALFEPIASSAQLSVSATHPAAPLFTLVDRDALRQALLNVLDNARKYGPGGKRIDVALTFDKQDARISVRDYGPGVVEDERALIFQRFRRGERYRDGSIPGVGLGLYLARVLLRQHGGELSCVKSAEPGARFEMRIPMNTNEELT